MELRSLGRTGVKVSPLCLGAMMFGAWGNTDHDESIRIIHRALDAGVNFVDTADVYSRGEAPSRAPDHFMSHLSITEAVPGDERPEANWGDHVTDDEYRNR